MFNIVSLAPQEDPRIADYRRALEILGPPRDRLGFIARAQLAMELIKPVADRFQGGKMFLDPRKTADLDMRDRYAGVGILQERWRLDLQRECQRALPPDSGLVVIIDNRTKKGIVNLVVDARDKSILEGLNG